jgi:hypothetical protein
MHCTCHTTKLAASAAALTSTKQHWMLSAAVSAGGHLVLPCHALQHYTVADYLSGTAFMLYWNCTVSLQYCSNGASTVLYCKSATSTFLQQWMVAIMQYCSAECQCREQPTMSCQHCWAHLKLQLCIGRDNAPCTPAAVRQLRGDQQQPAQHAQHRAWK